MPFRGRTCPARFQPRSKAFVTDPKPTPISFVTDYYYSVTSFRFTNRDGVSRVGRYRYIPLAGATYLSDAEEDRAPLDYLMDEATGTVMPRLGALENLFDGGAVTETNGGAGRVDHKLPGEVTGDDLVIVAQQFLEVADAGEAASVR